MIYRFPKDQRARKGGRAELIESSVRSYLAKAIIVSGLMLLSGCAVYFASVRDSLELTAIVHSVTPLMGFVLGHYFGRRDG